jgi:hypothetical protein
VYGSEPAALSWYYEEAVISFHPKVAGDETTGGRRPWSGNGLQAFRLLSPSVHDLSIHP